MLEKQFTIIKFCSFPSSSVIHRKFYIFIDINPEQTRKISEYFLKNVCCEDHVLGTAALFSNSFLARNEAVMNTHYPTLSPFFPFFFTSGIQVLLVHTWISFPADIHDMVTASLGLVSIWKIKRLLVVLWGFLEVSS